MISLTLQPSRTTLVLVWYQFMIYLITANLFFSACNSCRFVNWNS